MGVACRRGGGTLRRFHIEFASLYHVKAQWPSKKLFACSIFVTHWSYVEALMDPLLFSSMLSWQTYGNMMDVKQANRVWFTSKGDEDIIDRSFFEI